MEIFKDIKGYENTYQVSNYGRVKALHKVVKMPMGGSRIYDEKILSPRVGNHGYQYVNLCAKSFTVHRLVANTFLENPNKYKCVGHLDDIKTNNHIDNLEWCSHSQNNKRAYDTGIKKFNTKMKIDSDGRFKFVKWQ